MLKKLWLDEGGAILSVELLLLVVILVIGLTVGLVALRDAVVTQFGELALSVAAIDTSFGFDALIYVEGLGGGLGDGSGSTAWSADTLRIATYNVDGGGTVPDPLVIDGVLATEEKGDTSDSY